MRKPGYTLSKRMLWLNVSFSWACIAAIIARGLMGEAQAVSLAAIIVPSFVALIAALLGIHRFAGALDMRALSSSERDEESEAEEKFLPAKEKKGDGDA